MKRISVLTFTALTFACGMAAAAEKMGESGTFAISVDRVFGYVDYTQSYDSIATTPTSMTITKYESSTSQFAFLGHVLPTSVGQIPRFSFDAFVGPGISIGGSAMYDYYKRSNKRDSVENPDKPSTGIWLLSPRVGFAHMFTPVVGIWPRAGLTYFHTSTDSTNTDLTTGTVQSRSDSTSGLYYTMDVNLVVTPLPHVGFTVGPTLDYLLSYSQTSTPATTSTVTTSNRTERALGLQAGFLGWF